MNTRFEEMFEAKFGNTFSNESIKFATKAVMYEGWQLYKDYVNTQIPDFLIEPNKGE